jgi:cation diffusion facilitator family transporter
VRLFHPVPIQFDVAIPIAVLGLAVNVASAWLLSGADHGHSHRHNAGHGHAHAHGHGDEVRRIETADGILLLEVYEDGVPPRFRIRLDSAPGALPDRLRKLTVETVRPDGRRQIFDFVETAGCLESVEDIPEPHDFVARVLLGPGGDLPAGEAVFAEHDHRGHAAAHRDNNMRAAFVHVMADAAVSVLAILGLSAAWLLGWRFMDPLMGIVGMLVIANWSYGLIRDTGSILLDMTPDRQLAAGIRQAIETEGDRLTDLHLWRLGPGHLGAIVAIRTDQPRGPAFYRTRLGGFTALSHLTIEVDRAA